MQLSLCIIIFTELFSQICSAEKVRYMSTEHPRVTYFNPKYVSFVNLTSRCYGRSDPFYYVALHFDMLTGFGNNVSVHFYFYEFLTNRYRRGFVEMHYKLCDLVEKDQFFGTALRQGKLQTTCPFPPGVYHLYNMTIPLKHIPHNFPFRKGRIYCNISSTATDEPWGRAYIDMEIKDTHIKKRIRFFH